MNSREEIETSSTMPPPLGTPTNLLVAHRLERIDEFDRQLERALGTLDHIIGRSEVDNRGIGAVRFLIERSRKSLRIVRDQIAADAEVPCT